MADDGEVERTMTTAERGQRVMDLRGAGFSFVQIARNVPGLRSAGHARVALHRALAEQRKLSLSTDDRDTLEAEQLDRIERTVHGVMSNAQASGDNRLVLDCQDRLFKVLRHRADLAARNPAKPEIERIGDEIRARAAAKLYGIPGGKAAS